VEKGHAELDVEEFLGEPEHEDRDPGANPEHRQREGEEPIGQVASILLSTIVVAYDTTTNRHQIEGDADEDDLLDYLLRVLGETEGGDEEGGGEECPQPRQHPGYEGERGGDRESGDADTDRVVRQLDVRDEEVETARREDDRDRGLDAEDGRGGRLQSLKEGRARPERVADPPLQPGEEGNTCRSAHQREEDGKRNERAPIRRRLLLLRHEPALVRRGEAGCQAQSGDREEK
jgi:hypothetical protein